VKELLELKKINAKLEVGFKDSLLAQLWVWFVLWDRVLKVQQRDVKVHNVKNKVKSRVETPFCFLEDGMIVMGRWIYLSKDKALKDEVLKKLTNWDSLYIQEV